MKTRNQIQVNGSPYEILRAGDWLGKGSLRLRKGSAIMEKNYCTGFALRAKDLETNVFFRPFKVDEGDEYWKSLTDFLDGRSKVTSKGKRKIAGIWGLEIEHGETVAERVYPIWYTKLLAVEPEVAKRALEHFDSLENDKFRKDMSSKPTTNIHCAFIYRKTDEGHEYWKSVCDFLDGRSKVCPKLPPTWYEKLLAANSAIAAKAMEYYSTPEAVAWRKSKERFVPAEELGRFVWGFEWTETDEGHEAWKRVDEFLKGATDTCPSALLSPQELRIKDLESALKRKSDEVASLKETLYTLKNSIAKALA